MRQQTDYLLNSLHTVLNHFNVMSTHPALPDVVKDNYRQTALDLNGMISAAHGMTEHYILMGQGPASVGLIAAQKFLGVGSDINLDVLAVKLNFYKDEEVEERDTLPIQHRLWELFSRKFPSEIFPVEHRDGTDVRGGIPISFDHQGLTFRLTLFPSVEALNIQETYIGRISFHYSPPQCFWEVSGHMSRGANLFQRIDKDIDIHVVHHVDTHRCGLRLPKGLFLIEDVFLPKIEAALDFKLGSHLDAETSSASGLDVPCLVLAEIVEVLTEKGLMSDDPKVEGEKSAYDRAKDWMTSRVRRNLWLQFPDMEISLGLCTGSERWYDWADYEEHRKELRSWERAKPWIDVKQFTIHGQSVHTDRALIPTSLMVAIEARLKAFVNAMLIDDMLTEWESKDEQSS